MDENLRNFLDNMADSLKRMREDAGLTQRKLARLIGVDQSQISRIEKQGQDDISLSSVFKIAAALGMDTEFDFIESDDE